MAKSFLTISGGFEVRHLVLSVIVYLRVPKLALHDLDLESRQLGHNDCAV